MATLSGGASLRGGTNLTRVLGEIEGRVTKASTVQIGFLAGATYPDGTSVPMVAALNEFGVPSRNQPPRPFFRNMIAAKSNEWGPGVSETCSRQTILTPPRPLIKSAVRSPVSS